MATRQPEDPRFRLVKSGTVDSLQPISEQLSLFSRNESLRCTVAIFDARRATEISFKTYISSLRPRWVIDLRSSPRFDFGRLNRQLAFSLFNQINSRYIDLASTAPGHLVDSDDRVEGLLQTRVGDVGPCMGSVLYLLDRKPDPFKLLAAAKRVLSLPDDAEWKLAPTPSPEGAEPSTAAAGT